MCRQTTCRSTRRRHLFSTRRRHRNVASCIRHIWLIVVTCSVRQNVATSDGWSVRRRFTSDHCGWWRNIARSVHGQNVATAWRSVGQNVAIASCRVHQNVASAAHRHVWQNVPTARWNVWQNVAGIRRHEIAMIKIGWDVASTETEKDQIIIDTVTPF